MRLLLLALCIACAAATTKRCKSAEECDEGECCVNYVITNLFGGHCRKLREEGESCVFLEKKDEDKPNMYHFQCPCKDGLDCVAQHEIEIFGHIVRHKPECVVPGKEGDGDEDGDDGIGEPDAQ